MTPVRLQAAGGVLYRLPEDPPGDRPDSSVSPNPPDSPDSPDSPGGTSGPAGPEVLLIHRRGVWDLPKGKMEEGEGREACARREVAEEVGLDRLPRITADLGETRHSYRERGRMVDKQTFWYAMDGEPFDSFTPQREEDIERVAWVPLEEARGLVGYDNLVKVLDAFRDFLNRQG